MRARLAALLAGLALGAAPGAAELIEYRLPDGRTGYTNEPARVPPGAEILSSREVSPASAQPPIEPPDAAATPSPEPPASEAAAAPAAPAAHDPSVEQLEELRWRQRAREAQRAVREAQIRVEASERVYSDCRGRENYWYYRRGRHGDTRYYDPGFDSSCDDEGARLELAREELAEADSYLADGLFEDCRRSGCLPGWVR